MSINAQPFNPTFKLTGNLQQDQVLVYDVSENAFVNTIGSGTGGAGTGVDSVTNTGAGLQLADLAGSSLTMKSILAGENISITDNGSSIVLSASFSESIQSGTNLGSGTGLFANVDAATNQLQFKSIRVVGDLQLADDGQTITISYSGPANVSLDTTNNLSDVDNIALARSNLEVLSEAEANAKYVRLDSNSLPTQNNLFDIGSASLRFNDIYAETLQGTAVLSDNLTISGSEGDVLTRIGGTWVARPASQAQIDLSDYATTTELNTAITNIVHPNIPADVSDLTDTTSLLGQGGTTLDGLSSDVNTNTLTIEAGWDLIPATDGLQSLGSPSNRYTEIYIDNSTINIGGNAIEADADNDGNLLWNTKIVATQEYVQSVLPTPFSGSYDDLTDKPTLSGGGAALAFVGIAVDGQTQVLADGNADTLTFEAGDGMTITTDSSTDKIIFAQTGGLDLNGTEITGSGGSAITEILDVLLLAGGNNGIIMRARGASKIVIGDQAGDVVLGNSANSVEFVNNVDVDFTNTNIDFTNATITGLSAAGVDGAQGPTGPTGLTGPAGVDGAQGPTGLTGPAGVDGAQGPTGLTGPAGVDGTADYNALTNTPVLFDGAYTSLTGAPTIPTLDGLATQSWVIDQGFLTTDNDNQGLILTGSVLTITGSTTSIDLSTIISTVPTVVSALTNDAGYITSADVFSGSYNDLTDIPTVPVNLSDLTNVSSNAPTDGQHLVFDSATSKWKPSHASAGSETGYGDNDARSAFNGGVGLVYNASTGTYALNAQLSNLLDVDTTGISNGQVLKWNGAAFVPGDDTVLASTDQLSEGATNLWYTDTRVDNVLNGKTSSDFAEGTNRYFTSDRVNAILKTNIVAGTGINIVTGANDVRTISATVSSLDFSNITNTPTTLAGYGITDNVQGPEGEPGVAGAQGPKGDTGDTSTVPGPKGNDGDVGPQGVAGPAGPASTVPGPKGDDGDQGPAGPTGPAGTDGDQGPTGPAGSDGTDGVDGTGSAWADITNTPTTLAGYGITDAGNAVDLANESIGGLNDVNLAGITTGNFLSWDGTQFVATAQSAADLTQENLAEMKDISNDAPVNGDSLVWNGSVWAPQAVSSGSGGSGTTAEYFKLNYATNGVLESITNTTSGVSATILSTSGGDVAVTFDGYTFPPASILIYGYSRATNEYGIMPLNKDITTRKIAGGGVAGTPTAFGAMGSLSLTLKLREAETGASRSFGTPTHAWVMFTMI